jgi:hypothetical protein
VVLEKHHRARRGIALLLLLHAGLVAAPSLDLGQPGVPRWQPICLSILATTLSVGVWRASEWARCACATVALFLAVGFLLLAISLATADRTPPGSTWVDRIPSMALSLSLAGLWGVIGFYCLRPSTRQAFAAAREAMARQRGASH